MFKKLILFSLVAAPQVIPSVHANWSDYTLLGTINNVVFSYRTFDHSEVAKGSNLQFRAINLNSMRARVLISDVKFRCYDGSTENGRLLTKRIKGGETHVFDIQDNVCQERGGFESLTVSLDARVRR